jgi:hypothetical protein
VINAAFLSGEPVIRILATQHTVNQLAAAAGKAGASPPI